MNIRKLVLSLNTMDEMVAVGSLNEQPASFLDASVAAGQNVLVAGGT